MTKENLNIPINIDHIARIEGKAGIEVKIEKDELKEIKINVFEGPRFFEAITLGKPIEESTAIFPRVCSFCAAAHKITALQAAEAAIGVKVSKQTKLLRELLYLGDQIESHTLHLFLLALPDFLGYPDAFTMSTKTPQAVETALRMKDIGAKIQTEIGSRFMHQENAIIGGFGKVPKKRVLAEIRNELAELKTASELAFNLFKGQELWSEISSDRLHLALKPKGRNYYNIFGDEIHCSDGSSFLTKDYEKHIKEEVIPYSFAKHSMYKGKPFMTSALSRFVLFGKRLTGKAKELVDEFGDLIVTNNPLANNLAQAIELVYFMERAEELTGQIIETYKVEKPKKYKIKEPGTGISVTEAPRGLLTYTLSVDKKGNVSGANLITPTAMFLPQVELDLRNEINNLLSVGKTDVDFIKQRLEMIVRAYDPCVSCSVHVTEVKG